MSQNRRRVGIGTFLAIMMAAGVQTARCAADETPHEKARASLNSGLDWLRAHQKDSGAWSSENYPAVTALGLWAAAGSGRTDLTGMCERAAAFVAGFAQKDGGIYKPATGERGSGGLAVYNTAVCMTALHAFDRSRYAPLVLKAREYLAGSQLQGDSDGAGGFGYDRPAEGRPARADLSNTAWSLRAMRETQDVEDLRGGTRAVDIDWVAAVKFAEKLQNTDKSDPDNYGGFGYDQSAERGGTAEDKGGAVTLRGYGSMTYSGLESMIFAQVDRNDPRVRSALQWAAQHWSVDENPGMGAKGLFYYYNVMTKALSLTTSGALARPQGDPIPWKRQMIDKLVALQEKDGSWVNRDNTFWENDPALVTSYAILALEYAAAVSPTPDE